MVKLKVISFKRESRKKFKILFIIIIFLFLCVSFIKDLKLDKNIIDNKEIDYKMILGNTFVFFGDDNLLKENKSENINEKSKIDILKSNIELLGIIDKIDINNLFVENSNNNDYTNEDILNNLNESDYELSKEDEELLSSNFVYSNLNLNTNSLYEISAQNTNDIFDISLDNISRKLETKVILEKNKEDKYNVLIGNIKIRNESKYEINNDILNFDFELNDKENIVIYHTHTCESYTATEKYNYSQTGNYRSVDLSYSVSRVGDVLECFLEKLNYNVVHSKTYHDYPAYNGSYNRALTTVQDLLKNSTADIVIDLHRDAIGNNSDYGPTVEINGERVAQLMFVMGTDGGGLTHNDWKKNLKFAVEVQEKAEEMYPGLFKPIIVRNARYNEHVRTGAVIIEVGATGNTLEEAEGAMKYLSLVLDEYIKGK